MSANEKMTEVFELLRTNDRNVSAKRKTLPQATVFAIHVSTNRFRPHF